MEVNQYLEMFIEESKEHLQACSEHLLELEKNPENLTIVGEIFRSAHTLKGMSATMGFEDLADLTHKMENVLDAIRNEKIKVTAEILDVVFESVEHLDGLNNHPNALGFYQLTKNASKEVKVLLSGEGADDFNTKARRHEEAVSR